MRTVKEALRLADEDLDTATSYLTSRHLAGDPALTTTLQQRWISQWGKRSKRWLTALADRVDSRHAAAGEVAFLPGAEPEGRSGRPARRPRPAVGRGGRVGAAARATTTRSQAAYDVLLGARVELHRLAGRPGDVLALQDQDAVAAELGYADADALMAAVATSARTIAWTSDEAWRRVRSWLAGPSGREYRPDHFIAPGVILRDGEVHLAESARPLTDPVLPLRAATAAARRRCHIDRASLDRLAAEAPPFPDPWPAGASDDLVALLLEGHPAIPVPRVARPAWPARQDPARSGRPSAAGRSATPTTASPSTGTSGRRPPTPPRWPGVSLVPTSSSSAPCSTTSGKGYPGDHTDGRHRAGRAHRTAHGLRPPTTPRCWWPWCATTCCCPMSPPGETCPTTPPSRRSPTAVGEPLVLDLLAALTEADSLATGPSAWGTWKAELVAELVDRVGQRLGELPDRSDLDPVPVR